MTPARNLAEAKRIARRHLAERRAADFRTVLHMEGLPPYTREHLFAAPDRKWRFDFAWPAVKVALEIEGGIWGRDDAEGRWQAQPGRHRTGVGMLKDMEKYNAAAVLGWRIIRCQPAHLCREPTLRMLAAALTVTVCGRPHLESDTP